MAIIILLMGVSSTGKTTLANHLVKVLSQHFIIDGFDHAVERSLEKKYWPGGEFQDEGFKFIKGPDGRPQMRMGTKGAEFFEFMLSDIIRKAKEGNNIIIDYVPSEKDIARFKEELPEATFIMLGLQPPLEWVIKREQERGDREVGMAAQDYVTFYDKEFDLVLDPSKLTPEQSTAIIKKFIDDLGHTHSWRSPSSKL